jgi:Ca2+-dependent lipid-binding protein
MRRQADVDFKDGVMRKEYLCQVTVIEARNLKINNSTGMADPFVRITVANLPPQITNPLAEQTSGAWNQSFTFTGVSVDSQIAKS